MSSKTDLGYQSTDETGKTANPDQSSESLSHLETSSPKSHLVEAGNSAMISSPVDDVNFVEPPYEQKDKIKDSYIHRKMSAFRASLIEGELMYRGSITKRTCTDVLCCFGLSFFLIGYFIVSIYAFSAGNPLLLVHPMDSKGNICGVGKYKDKPNLFMFDLLECAKYGPAVFYLGCPTPQVCVANCPDYYYVFLQDVATQNKTKLICQDGVDVKSKKVEYLVANKDCAAYTVRTKPALNRCLPAPVTFDDSGKILVKNNSTITLVGSDKTTIDGKILNNAFKLYDIYIEVRKYRVELTKDVENSQSFICVFLLLAMILSFVWIVAMRFIAVYMVWLSIAVILALSGIFTFVFWKNYFHYKGSDEVTYLPWIDSAKEIKTEIVFLIGGLLFGVLLCILNVVVLCLCSTITLSVNMIECASKVVTKMWLTLLWPVVPFLLHIANIAYAASAVAYMASVERRDKMDLNSSNIVVDFKESLADKMNCKDIDVSEANKIGCDLSSTAGNLKVIMLFIFFMYLWLKNFVCGLNQLTLAGVFASYYWTLDKTTLPKYTLLKSFYRCFRYHCGSLAFGSFLITFVQFLTALLNLVKSNIENSTNQLAKFVIRCLLCCFKLHDMFLQFIHKRAYIMMAIEGKNFCLSAKRALSIMLNNFVKSLVLAKVTDFLLIISKLIITSMIGVLAYFYIQKKIPLTIVTVPELNFYFIPLFVILIGTYSISGVFFDVYGTAVDTIFLCFLDDIEKNDGSNARPHFMDEHLESIFKGKSFQRRLTISYEKPENFKDSDTRKKSLASSASV